MTEKFKEKRVLLAFPDERGLTEALRVCEKLHLTPKGSVSGFEEVKDFLKHTECDFVFISVLLPMLPAENPEQAIHSLALNKRPAILYFAPRLAGEKMLSAYSPTLTLPTDTQNLEKTLDEIYPVRVKEKDIQKAKGILFRMGFTEHTALDFIAYASAMCANDISIVSNLRKNVYPALSRAFGRKESAFSDAMRRLIDKTFLSGDIESQYRLFGNSIDETRGKPTVRELIALVGDMLRRGVGQ